MNLEGKISFQNAILEPNEVTQKILNGEFLVLAGDRQVLDGLPSGNWIGGTIPYFMGENGGHIDQKKIYTTTIAGITNESTPRISMYDKTSISRISQEAPSNGFTLLIMPAGSDVHLDYAQSAPEYPNMFFSPIIGWIAGTHLDEINTNKPKVGFGPAGLLSEDKAVVMHVPLGEDQFANVNIVNLFEQGNSASIEFKTNGFSIENCVVDGQETSFSQYIKDNGIDTRLPLVADYCGVMVNVSIQEVLDDKVNLYAPVFENTSYRFAKPIDDYVTEFDKAIAQETSGSSSFACNCILNFLYGELEGRKTGNITGPMTFGEVAYQLVNQTMVYLTLEDTTI